MKYKGSMLSTAALCAAVSVMSLPAHAQESAADEALEPIDTVTIIGRKSDVADRR